MLYVVATPIGNLQDLSPRAREVLASVKTVLCEDTRVTKKLLNAYEIDVHVESVHQHTSDAALSKLADRMMSGEDMAYVSDAGTPGISDPGGKLVAAVTAAGGEVSPIPGPSAVIAALSVSGFPADKFTFVGFPPQKKGRAAYFDDIDAIESTVALYESKHRILKTLEQLPQDRPMMVARELTKMHETVYRGTAPEIIAQLNETSQKGEFAIVLAPKNWKL